MTDRCGRCRHALSSHSSDGVCRTCRADPRRAIGAGHYFETAPVRTAHNGPQSTRLDRMEERPVTPIQLDDPRLAPIDAAARAFAGNVQEVGTGGGINAVLFDLANSTFSVFVDQELPGFAVQRHTSTDAFWNCQHGCRSVHVDDPAILAAYAPAALAVACPGTDDCTCDEMPS